MSPLLETQKVVLVCKSSGVNMLTQWLNNLENEISLPRFRIISLGPVSQKLLNNKILEALVIKEKKIHILNSWIAIQEYSSGYGSL